eukprot:SAG31_NODE_3716_length_3953_cov_1.724961_3_plen_115_part_00
MARPDINCVVHNHHQDTVAISMTKEGLLPMSQESHYCLQTLSYHPFEGTASDASERERMGKSIGPTSKMCIMQNHGPLTMGVTVAEAFANMCACRQRPVFVLRAKKVLKKNRWC